MPGNDADYDRFGGGRARGTNATRATAPAPAAPVGSEVVHDGSIADADYKALEAMVAKYGPIVVTQKVAKVCTRKAGALGTGWESSAIVGAYKSAATKIASVFGT